MRAVLAIAAALSTLGCVGGGADDPGGGPSAHDTGDTGDTGGPSEPEDSEPEDGDGDGVPAPADCDDTDASVAPGADETCDGRDNDCDGVVDEDPVDGVVTYGDADGDGAPGTPLPPACDPPAEAPREATDCDDADATVSPGAVEVCDGRDHDCDGALLGDAVVPTDLPTLQAAVDAVASGALSSDGGAVRICLLEGEHVGPVVVEGAALPEGVSVALEGAGAERSTLGSDGSGPALSARGAGLVEVVGLTVDGGGVVAGLDLDEAAVALSDVAVRDAGGAAVVARGASLEGALTVHSVDAGGAAPLLDWTNPVSAGPLSLTVRGAAIGGPVVRVDGGELVAMTLEVADTTAGDGQPGSLLRATDASVDVSGLRATGVALTGAAIAVSGSAEVHLTQVALLDSTLDVVERGGLFDVRGGSLVAEQVLVAGTSVTGPQPWEARGALAYAGEVGVASSLRVSALSWVGVASASDLALVETKYADTAVDIERADLADLGGAAGAIYTHFRDESEGRVVLDCVNLDPAAAWTSPVCSPDCLGVTVTGALRESAGGYVDLGGVDAADWDLALQADSPLRGACPDGSDIGAGWPW